MSFRFMGSGFCDIAPSSAQRHIQHAAGRRCYLAGLAPAAACNGPTAEPRWLSPQRCHPAHHSPPLRFAFCASSTISPGHGSLYISFLFSCGYPRRGIPCCPSSPPAAPFFMLYGRGSSVWDGVRTFAIDDGQTTFFEPATFPYRAFIHQHRCNIRRVCAFALTPKACRAALGFAFLPGLVLRGVPLWRQNALRPLPFLLCMPVLGCLTPVPQVLLCTTSGANILPTTDPVPALFSLRYIHYLCYCQTILLLPVSIPVSGGHAWACWKGPSILPKDVLPLPGVLA